MKTTRLPLEHDYFSLSVILTYFAHWQQVCYTKLVSGSRSLRLFWHLNDTKMAKRQKNKLNQEQKKVNHKMATKKGTKTTKKKELEIVHEQLTEMTIQHNELKDKFLRLFAEFDNYKKRTIKEKMELMRTAAESTMVSLLPILDDFDRAKKSADDEKSDEQWSDGVKLVYNRLYTVLNNDGLEAMESDGQPFDPEMHDAITEIPAPSDDLKGKVVDTIEKGYFLKEKLIRHAKVVVGK
jgi:molecular chaperone GrpE